MSATLIRKEEWPALLTQFVEARWGSTFEWGSNDCCLFAADWVKLCTGVDVAKALRGTYTTSTGAMLAAAHAGVSSPEDPYGAMGWPGVLTDLAQVDPRLTRRGDVCAVRTSEGTIALGVSVGFAVAAPGPQRLLFMPFESILSTWRL